MRNTVVVYTDFICPWCYIGDHYLAPFIASHNLNVEYVMYPLHPETPSQGLRLTELFAGRNMDIGNTQNRIQQKAHSLGLAYTSRTHTYNSLNAQILGKYFASKQLFEPYKKALFHSYFGLANNISNVSLLQELGSTISGDTINISAILNDELWKSQVQADWDRCRKDSITGIPTLCYQNHYCVGAQSSSTLETFFNSNH